MKCPKCKSKDVDIEQSGFGDMLPEHKCNKCKHVFSLALKEEAISEKEMAALNEIKEEISKEKDTIVKLHVKREKLSWGKIPKNLKIAFLLSLIMVLLNNILFFILSPIELSTPYNYMSGDLLFGSFLSVFLIFLVISLIFSGLAPMYIAIFYQKKWAYVTTLLILGFGFIYVLYKASQGVLTVDLVVVPVICFLLFKEKEWFS